jgi:hypothetical protein
LSQILNPDSAGKERNRLVRSVVVALRELMKQSQPDDLSRDLAAFIVLALERIAATIDLSVTAWEKRGYWIKADRFRMEWAWTERNGKEMRQALLADDWGAVAASAAQIAQKLMAYDVPKRHRLGEPWVGAWNSLQKQSRAA